MMLMREGQPAVSTPTYLGLVDVDEDPWVAQRSATAVTGHDSVFRPSYGLFVDEGYSGFWLRL